MRPFWSFLTNHVRPNHKHIYLGSYFSGSVFDGADEYAKTLARIELDPEFDYDVVLAKNQGKVFRDTFLALGFEHVVTWTNANSHNRCEMYFKKKGSK